MFDKALNRASTDDVQAITRFVFLTTGDNTPSTDPIWQRAESDCLLLLISNEVTSRKVGRSFQHIYDLVKQGPEAVEPIVTRLLPEWRAAGRDFQKGVLAGLAIRLQDVCLADESLALRQNS